MRLGRQTFNFDKVYIKGFESIAGPLEGKGNFSAYYDNVLENDEYGCKSHEKAEIKMHKEVIDNVIKKNGLSDKELDCILGGDLLNQIITTSFSAREFETPFLGLYEACSTFGECLLLGAMMINAGYMENVVCCTSSHFSTAERQYRYPLELGTQATPTSQWTVTGAGASLLSTSPLDACKIKITSATLGKIVDLGITNVNNMGAAMAPAACDTIIAHLKETGRTPDYYDVIFTGDLGKYGRDLLHFLAKKEGYDLACVLNDCGALIFKDDQKVVQGGSGAGCSSVVFNSYIIKEMVNGLFNKVLLVPTGALLSRLSSLQGETIPAIAHAIAFERVSE